MAVRDDQAREKGLLRFLTCGSVDDGKSTLIGHLLFDCNEVSEDTLARLHSQSEAGGRAGASLDYSLLVDGLMAEREQGITIDVAYRYFSTQKRKFIVADTPGHEQYTRNMATGASNSDLAILLVDARKGLQIQTKRHSKIVSLMGIRHLVLAVNKMDLVDYDQTVFDTIVHDYAEFAQKLGACAVQAIPLSALNGDNLSTRSAAMDWFDGPTLREHLEGVDLTPANTGGAFRLPVQLVNRPDDSFRGYCGTLSAGSVRVGDAVRIGPTGEMSSIDSILTPDGQVNKASAGEAVTVTLADERDISRGNVIAAADDPPPVSDQFAAHVIWMHQKPLLPGRQLQLRLGAQSVNAAVTKLKYVINYEDNSHNAGKVLGFNETGYCNLALDHPVVFDTFENNRDMGSFILVDKLSNETVGAGMIAFGLRRADNVHWQAMDVDKNARAALKGQKPCILWFTGLSGSGKSTIANLLEKRLLARGGHTYLLDGDNVRHGLNRDLGFTDADRVENIRRISEVSKLMVDAGLLVMVSFISPFRSERDMARQMVEGDEFVEVFVDTPLDVCEARDVKGLYKKARAGEIKNFTGIDSPYEAPKNPEIHLQAGEKTPEELAEVVFAELEARGIV
ncbi:MAG: adenylyl-sulfate kinase [Robiginitomaculum sp.]|nr:MAG: adenylyl-sulfate kinase [Robiginitomaculum sp.]